MVGRIPQVMRMFGFDPDQTPGDDTLGADICLGEYAKRLCGRSRHSAEPKPLQDGDDLLAVAGAEAKRLLGDEHARALIRTLEDDFCALTANHHGVDFHPEFAQGMLIFALARWNKPAVPVFSVGGVPMNNVSFPRGLCLGSGVGSGFRPRQIPIFPLRCKHTLVCAQPPFSREMLHSTAQSAAVRDLADAEKLVVNQLLGEVYAAQDVLAQKTFSDQATLLNSRIWSDCFTPEVNAPKLISLDMQSLSGQLAVADAVKAGSLFQALVLEPEGAAALYHALDGKRACWTLEGPEEHAKMQHVARGTFLFWALDEEGRAISMSLDATHHTLRATQRPDLDVALTRKDIELALVQKRIMPSLFLYFALLAMARGLRCCGGVYQLTYLPDMAAGVRHALRACGAASLAEHVEATSPLSTGFLPVRRMAQGNKAMPAASYAAGLVEFLMHGGLGVENMERMRHLSTRDAFAVALAYHYEDLVSEAERLPDWNTALQECDVACGIEL